MFDDILEEFGLGSINIDGGGIRVSLSDDTLSIFDALLDAGDRGAFHLVYAVLTGVQDAFLTAKISTFSDTVGGIAYAANRYLEAAFGEGGFAEGESEPNAATQKPPD